MKLTARTMSLVFALLIGGATVLPLTVAKADAPNTRNNATVTNASTGHYDGFDRFRDETGRPRQGWQYLFYSAS